MSRLANKFATNKLAETQGILYEEVDDDGPIFHVRIARLGGQNKKYSERLSELMKPYRRMKAEDMNPKTRDRIFLKCICETVLLPGTWETYSTEEDKWLPGIEDPATGQILTSTAENYQKVLEQLPELADRLTSEASSFDNYKAEVREAEAKN